MEELGAVFLPSGMSGRQERLGEISCNLLFDFVVDVVFVFFNVLLLSI